MSVTAKNPHAKTTAFPRLYLALDDLRCIRPFMADFFKVMRNHRVACLLTMQQEEQWDLLNLAPMKNVIRGLLSLKLFYRPETIETAEKMALVLNRYDAMGDTREYMTTGRGRAVADGTSETDGWSDSESESSGTSYGDGSSHGDQAGWQFAAHVGEDGQGRYLSSPSISGGTNSSATRSDAASSSSARTAGTSGSASRSRTETTSENETTQMHIVSAREQVFVDAQHLLSFDMQRHDAVVRWEDRDGQPKAAFVNVSPFPKQPSHRDGRPVLQQYRAAVARFTRRSARTLYKATVPSIPDVIEAATTDIAAVSVVRSAPSRTSPSSRPVDPTPRVDLFPPRPGDLIEREMRAIYALEAVATIHLCTVQILMLLFDWSYDKAYRELEGLVAAGHVDRIRGFAPRGEGSVPTTYIINGNGASALAEHGRDREELHRVAKNLGVYRRAVEKNRPTQERHRMYSAMLATILIASARSIDRDATVSDLLFDRERVIPVDLASVGDIPTRDRTLVNLDPSKQTVSYVPDFSFTIRWTIDGKPRTEAIFGEVETGFGERDAHDLAVGKAWKIRALLKLFETRFTLGDHTFEADAMPRIVVWSRTAPLEQRFFEGAASVFKDRMSPFWFTHGELLPLAIPTGTAKKGIAAEVRKLVENVQQPVWRWLRFPDANDRRRFVGVRRSA